ncbi:MAG: prephenate dehydrogenase [Candidatus Omnitrophota bacterium]
MFNKAAIVGTGLIGGSLGLALKKKGLAREVVGVSRHQKNIVRAIKLGAVDKGSRSLDIIGGADLVVLAMPVGAILSLAPAIARYTGPGCVVTDVGSTKEQIVSSLTGIFPCFVGSHPLAGSEKRGVSYAQTGLFNNSVCIVTPVAKTRAEAVRKVRKLWVSVGARVVILDPKKHDRALSLISHLPHVAAFSLMNVIPVQFLAFAPPSLREATRVAASDGELWSDIMYSNKKNIIAAIEALRKELFSIESAVKYNATRKLHRILNAAKIKREKIR